MLEGSDIFSVNWKNKRGGSAAFSVHIDFQCRVIDNTTADDIESLKLEI